MHCVQTCCTNIANVYINNDILKIKHIRWQDIQQYNSTVHASKHIEKELQNNIE